ncbi:hypothetical protein KMZ32_15355 [Phycicoccus sp. MAQZ13P-2]|uniref:hypothetical protein n=1 Tax=Phycicoccus mangrovi TaxID=2840470 RepID=UPI001BFFEA03|nr:hypothetical protein [Phycicoccus mangrovi]MBT9257057.1 hypothetical protein [Phycicoccus mangrovi]MBT9275453.1 hypothetical protein [Phycicoccus mangrovi]
MLDTAHPRDLVMVGAVFGLATFIWSGWAQEGPPRPVLWRVLLGALGVAGLALAGWSTTQAVRHWSGSSAIEPGSRAFTVHLVVGLHFVALAVVFSQPVLHLTAGLLVAVAVLAALVPAGAVARSFWCGVLGAPVFLAVGLWCALTGEPLLDPSRAGGRALHSRS